MAAQTRDPGSLLEETQGHFPFNQREEEETDPHNAAPMGCEPHDQEEDHHAEA